MGFAIRHAYGAIQAAIFATVTTRLPFLLQTYRANVYRCPHAFVHSVLSAFHLIHFLVLQLRAAIWTLAPYALFRSCAVLVATSCAILDEPHRYSPGILSWLLAVSLLQRM